MTTPDDRLADLLERWEGAAAAGQRLTPEDLCRDTPDDLPAFRHLLHQLGLAGLATVSDGPADTAPADTFRAGRYTALAYHAAGGLGVVYRARDEELNRPVALKCMKQPGGADSPAGRRFLLEAEVTSRLDHPGVAPVHGRGATEDGRPFYAMRFVEGETLQEAARRFHAAPADAPDRNVELRRLLRAFVAVCETVAYAHAKGYVHRDLKPANVMVGPFGETLVMDWGLAKPFRDQMSEVRSQESVPEPGSAPAEADTPADGQTEYGRAKGSPAFMSPEQAAGEWDRVGPASDVYSLGSTLFYLLTGQPPYTGRSGAEVIARVREGRFAPPRAVRPDVPAALDAVCRKAMAFAPAGRYASARELAADVERWLADEPVTAWREPLGVRARRWVRRHRTLVTATGAAAGVGVVLLAAAGYRLDQKNRDLERANEREVGLRVQADERFQIALEANASLVSDIQTKLIRAPGTRSVRESLLTGAMARLDRLLQKADETREANRAIVAARLRLGDLYRDVDRSPTRAAAEYARALELARALREHQPDDPALTRAEATALLRLGTAEADLGQFGRAAERLADAARLIDTVAPAADPDRARILAAQGQLALETGDALAAAARLTAARAEWQARPDDPDAAVGLAEVALGLGQAAHRAGREAEAVTQFTDALARWQALEAGRPEDVTVRRMRALAHNGLAEARLQLGDRAAAGTHHRAFFDLAKVLADEDPENAETVLELALAHAGLALDAGLRRDVAGAEEHYTESARLVERVAGRDPANLTSRRNLAVARTKLAQAAGARQRPADAAARFAEAIQECRTILQVAPDRTVTRADLADWLRELGQTHLLSLPDKAAGLAALADSLAEWETLAATDPANLVWQARRLEAYRLLGHWQRADRKTFDRAEATLRSGLAAADRLPAGDRDHPPVRRAVGLLHVELAGVLLDRGQRPAAAELAEREVQSLTRAAADRPDDPLTWELLARQHAFLADLHRRQNRADAAAEHLRLGIDAARRGLSADPDAVETRQVLQVQLGQLAEQAMTRDPAGALKLFREALEHSDRFPPEVAESAALHTRFGGYEALAGDCCEMLNRPKDGLDHYTRARDHHTRVTVLEPAGPGVPGILAYDHRRLAELRLTLLDFPAAVREYEQAKEVLDRMRADRKRLTLLDLQTDSLVKSGLPFAKSLPAGVETLDAAMKQPADQRLNALRLRVAWLLAGDREAEAAETAERMVAGKDPDHEVLARAAVEFARLAGRPGPKAKDYAARAVELLGRAKAAGYFRGPDDAAWLDWEPLFDPLRNDEGFRALVKELAGKK